MKKLSKNSKHKKKKMEQKTKVKTPIKFNIKIITAMVGAVIVLGGFLAFAAFMSQKDAPVKQSAVVPTVSPVDFKSVQDAARVVYTPETWESEFSIEDEVTTSFTISNLSDKPQNLKVVREIPSEEILVEYPEGALKKQQLEHITIPYLEYDVSLDSDESKTIEVRSTYTIVPPMGSFDLPLIDIMDANTGEKVTSSRSYEEIVIGCKEDGICDTSIRENRLNCPQDCPSGEEDDLCDMEEDNKCDPDCLTELDTDCGPGEGITKIPSLPRVKPMPDTIEEVEVQITEAGLSEKEAEEVRELFRNYQEPTATTPTEAEIRKINSDFLESKTELFQSVPKQPTTQNTSESSFNILDVLATEALADEDNPDDADMEYAGIPFDPDAKPGKFCEGGTPAGECSEYQPWYCTEQMESIEDCVRCGCSDSLYYGKYCQPEGNCENTPYGYCDDGTIIGECSDEEWPRYCNMDGELVLDCNQCGCPDIPTYSCNESTGVCGGCGNGTLDEGEECDGNFECGNADDTCYLCQCVSERVPGDTTCQSENDEDNYEWTNHSNLWSCIAMPVTSTYGINFLDSIVDDAIDCCIAFDGVIPQRHQEYCQTAHLSDPQSGRDCITRFISTGLHDGYINGSSDNNDILWLTNFYYPKYCCGNDQESCTFGGGETGTCSPDDFQGVPYNDYVLSLTCDDYYCQEHDFTAIESTMTINSGSCTDWVWTYTTLLRKTGFFPANHDGGENSGDGVLGVRITQPFAHAVNLVWMDKFSKYVFVEYGSLKFDPPSDYCNHIKDCHWWHTHDDQGHENYEICADDWDSWADEYVYGCD